MRGARNTGESADCECATCSERRNIYALQTETGPTATSLRMQMHGGPWRLQDCPRSTLGCSFTVPCTCTLPRSDLGRRTPRGPRPRTRASLGHHPAPTSPPTAFSLSFLRIFSQIAATPRAAPTTASGPRHRVRRPSPPPRPTCYADPERARSLTRRPR